jgi:hypothetical protein
MTLQNNRNAPPPDDEPNYGLPEDRYAPIDTKPIVPGVLPATGTVPYLSGTIPQQFQLAPDLINTDYANGRVPSVRLMPVQGGATVNAATSSVTKPIADTANAAQTTANSASKTAATANTTATTANTTANNALPTPQNLSYRPLSNPLTSVDDGGGFAEIDVAAFSLRVRSKTQTTDVSYNSGTITGLSNSTLYFVYLTDATFAGGTVTYNATTTKENTLSNSGNIFVGSILTAASGGSETIGNNDGGVGGQTGNQLIIWPSANSSTYPGSSGAWTNPSFSYDANPTTAATAALNARSLVLSGFASAIPPGAQSVQAVFDYVVASGGDFLVSYSTNGGSSFTSLFTANSTTRVVSYQSLPLNINPGAVQIANVVGPGVLCSLYGMYLLFTF